MIEGKKLVLSKILQDTLKATLHTLMPQCWVTTHLAFCVSMLECTFR